MELRVKNSKWNGSADHNGSGQAQIYESDNRILWRARSTNGEAHRILFTIAMATNCSAIIQHWRPAIPTIEHKGYHNTVVWLDEDHSTGVLYL